MVIKVAEPSLGENVRRNVLDCLDEGWISSAGKYIQRFETEFAEYCGSEYAVATNNGTTALHLALVALDLRPGDEVIIPNLTYIATANAVAYCGAVPVFVDSDEASFNIDAKSIENAITDKTVGIIPVHLYGHPCDMKSIMSIAQKRGLWILEDAAEAHGAEVDGKRVGTFGNAATFSFFGNKVITTGEGGCITTNDQELAVKMRRLRSQGMDTNRRYWFPEIGFNYRMTNIQAAIGVAQLEDLENLLSQRARIAQHYWRELASNTQLKLPSAPPNMRHSMWMFTPRIIGASAEDRDAVMRIMERQDIETRPVFYPMSVMPPYFNPDANTPIAIKLSNEGLNLPTHANLSEEDVARVCAVFQASVAEVMGSK